MSRGHWFDRLAGAGERAGFVFLVQQESLYASEANYRIGHEFATQKTPYADLRVLLTRAREPAAGNGDIGSLRMRARDLRHRFLGEPEERSFQRGIVRRRGGVCASVPVNWGWRPRGGMALAGAMQGLRACTDMSAHCLGLHAGPLAAVLRTAGITGYGEFHDPWLMRSPQMRDYLRELLDGSGLLDGDIFDNDHVHRCLSAAREDRQAIATRSYLLDVALAFQNFTSTANLNDCLQTARS
jgi:hypothetical protein